MDREQLKKGISLHSKEEPIYIAFFMRQADIIMMEYPWIISSCGYHPGITGMR